MEDFNGLTEIATIWLFNAWSQFLAQRVPFRGGGKVGLFLPHVTDHIWPVGDKKAA